MKFLLLALLALGAVALSPPVKPPPTTAKPLPTNPFSVVAPNTIRRGKSYRVFVRGLDIKRTTNIVVALASDDGSFKIERPVRLSSSTTSAKFSFDTSALPAAATGFTLTVTSGEYSESKSVTFVTKEASFFVQTNKAIFKPLDLIQFRIFSIDSESNAVNPKGPVVVTLTDPRNNEIGKLDSLTFVNGKYEGQWQLPSKPIFGTWRLSVQVGGEEDEAPIVKTLTVDEYVLSLFTASLSVPSQVSYSSSQIPITINAEYTFKQPISGVATVTLTKQNGDVFMKNVSCTGKSTTFFVNIVSDLGYTDNSYYFTQISLVFIDPKTNTKAIDQTEVTIVPFKYTLQIVNEPVYRPGQTFKFTVAAKTLDGKPVPSTLRLKITITVTIGDVTVTVTITIGRNGLAQGSTPTSPRNPGYLNIQATAKDCQDAYAYARPLGVKPSAGISLNLVNENPSFNDQVNLIATTGEEISSFFYFVTSKGVLLESGRIYMDEDGDPDYDSRTVEFSIYPDFTYAPSMRIYAYYYNKRTATFSNTNLYVEFKKELPNYLNLSPRGADSSGNVVLKPGADISLKVDSKPNSIVSLAAVDQRVLQLANSQNFTFDQVIESFSGYNGFGGFRRFRPWYYDPYNAIGAGLLFYTNIPRNDDNERYLPRPGAPEEAPREKSDRPDGGSRVKVRKDFREVFLWEDVSVNRPTTITRKVPESITTYLIYGVSMNKYEGMGLPSNLPSATIFLPFFISAEMPSTIKRGESFAITIQVFNFLGSSQTATLAVANDARFEAVNADSNGWTVSRDQFTQVIRVANNEVFTASFIIKPTQTGVINIKVSVKSPTAGDAIEKPLRIIPEGVARSITTSTLIAIDAGTVPDDKLLQCNLPASAFQDTVEVSATVIGDILGKALNNLDNLIMMPGGCGEQNMIGFVPDYAILVYLTATGQLTPALQTKLTNYLTIGYQNQLNYQRDDGSFSAFGNSDPSGSTWLTAYVIMYFKLASPHIAGFNSAVIQNGLNFIIAQQNADGSFNEPGRVIHSDMQGDAGSGIALTAYVAIALSTLADAYPDAVGPRDRAIAYLEQQLSTVTSAYPLAVIANALQLVGSPSATDAFNTFFDLKTETPTEIKWSVPAPTNQNYYGARSLDIEVTAYGLKLLVARSASLSTSLKVVKYLMSQSNSFGGYSSSQDTVMALIALSNFALTYTVGQANVNLALTPNAGTAFNAQVTAANALTVQTFGLDAAARELNVHVNTGSTGVAIVSLICNFYEDPSKVVPSYDFTYNFDGSCQWRLQVQICPRLIEGTSSNMAIMEVRLPSGYYYYEAWWIQSGKSVSKVETYEDNTVVVFYLNSVSSDGSCVTFGAGKTYNVIGLKPGSVIINDYYDTSKQGSTSFTIPADAQSAPCNTYY